MKKYIQNIKNIVACICIAIHLFLLIGGPTVAYSTESTEMSDDAVLLNDTSNNTAETVNNSVESTLLEVTYTVTNPINPISPTTAITFDKTNIDSFVLNASGLVIGDSIVDEAADTVSYNITATENFGTLEVFAQANGEIVANKTIYTYRHNNSIYISEASKDIAWHKCMQDLFDNNLITIDDWHTAYSEQSLSFSENDSECSFDGFPEINEDISNGEILVRGRMSWTTDSGAILPMRFTKVELRKKLLLGSDCIQSTFTDENGYYFFVLDYSDLSNVSISPVNIFVRTHTESITFDVCYPLREDFNYFDSHIETISSSTSGTINISRKLISDNSHMPYKLSYIQQGMVVGQRFALERGMVVDEDEKLYVFHLGDLSQIVNDLGISEWAPNLDLNDNCCCFDRISFIAENHFNDFVTVNHEYGHYVENRMGNYGNAVKGQIFAHIPEIFDGKFISLSNCLEALFATDEDYSHNLWDNHFDENSGKDFQMQLTWSESWAYVFADIAMQKYASQYVGVGKYSHSPLYESLKLDDKSGEAQENAVINFLWDLYDKHPETESTKEVGDNIGLDESKWWEITTKSGTYTLQDLSENIIENYPDLINGVGEILSKNRISPEISSTIMLPCSNDDETLVITCTVNGSASHPNDKFKVVFYDSDYNVIDETSIVSDSVEYYNSHTQTVPKEVWMRIMNQYEEGEKIYATVYGYRSGEFDSGPYFSELITVWDDSNNHIYDSKHFDSNTHWGICGCGVEDTVKVEHNICYSYYTPTQHYRQCSECGYQTHEDHEYNIVTSVTDEGHIFSCICGESKSREDHYAYSYAKNNISLHHVYCECGQLIGSAPHVLPAGALKIKFCIHCNQRVNTEDIVIRPYDAPEEIRYITDAGSYVGPDGNIYLVESDMALYLAGELDVYALAESINAYPTV